jgi:hypothetical protein
MTGRTRFAPGRSSAAVLLSLMGLGSCAQDIETAGAPGEEPTVTSAVLTGFNVTTRAYNIQRTGANTGELALNPTNVTTATFGKLFTIAVDDEVYAQPLYASNMTIAGGTHNVVFIATVNNTISAFDADVGGSPLWSRNFNNGGRPVNHNEVGGNCVPYNDFSNNIGIVGTPVIDGNAMTLFLVTRTVEAGAFVQRLRALDITNGNERVGARTIGTINAQTNNQRPALALSQNKVYVGWSSYCDTPPYEGRVMAFNTSDLSQAASFSAAPGGGLAGIWMAGAAPTIDGNGNLFYSTGNGAFDGVNSFGETLLRLSPTLGVVDWFTPPNWASLNSADLDLGSSGPVFVPGTSLLTMGGKGGGTCYLVDANNMKHLNLPFNWHCVDPDNVRTGLSHHLHNSMVTWNGPSGVNLYTWGENDFGRMWRFNGSTFNTPAASVSNVLPPQGMPGGMMSLSSNGSGNGILWVTMPLSGDANHDTVPGILRAFDATNLTRELWNSTIKPADDPGNFTKGSAPVIANGKVYVASLSRSVSAYGLTAAMTTEAESAPVAGFTSGRLLRVFSDTSASAGAGRILESHAVGDFVSLTINVQQTAVWRIIPRLKKFNNRAIWQLSIDGANQGGAQDGFASGFVYTDVDLGTRNLTAGNHTFRFQVTGRNGASSDFWIALDAIKLTR